MTLPQQGVGLRTARGVVGVWTPSPGIVIAAIAGQGDAGFVEPILAPLARATATPISMFFDLDGMTNYDSQLRTKLTAKLLAERARVTTVQVLVRAKIVAMGVSVAGLALGGLLTSHDDRQAFKKALDECLYEQRVVGFSSNVLDALQVGA